MAEPKFVHLRVHTAYSLSEGAMLVPALMKRCKENNIAAIAITDTANMFGGKAFSHYAEDNGIKPILGCQFNLRNPDADDPLKSKGRVIDPDKIILLVMSAEGYTNIMKLMKLAYLDGPNMEKPQILMEHLKEHNAGLIMLTGGIEGPVGRFLLTNQKEKAEQTLLELKKYFGNRLYMEISRIGLEAEKQTEERFIDLAYQHNIPLVATNEAFFFDTDMYEAHDILMCIAAGEYAANENRPKKSSNNRLKSEQEMIELFKDLPEAVQNTVQIAKRCNYLSKKVQPLLPIFECPDGKTQDEYITEEAYKGLDERMKVHVYFEGMTPEQKAEIDKQYYARLEYELSVIKKMGFPGYFLIVSDFIRWSKNNGVPVGPGRGSGAGSIVAWSLKITELDPIKLDLLFERFLNPERVNMPDFDVDFCQENRFKTIDYVQRKYGFDHVAQIITYGKLQAKNVIRDVARVLQMPYSQADKLSKMIPPPVQGKNVTLKEALEQVPELEEMRKNEKLSLVRTSFEGTTPGMFVQIDNQQASRIGISKTDVAINLATQFGDGLAITKVWEEDYAMDVTVKDRNAGNNRVSDLKNANISGNLPGISVPLRQIAKPSADFTEGQITRRNGIRCISIYAEVKRGENLTNTVNELDEELKKISLPDGVTLVAGGQKEKDAHTIPQIINGLLISIFVIFVILIFHLRNIRQSLLLMLSLPACLLGAALGVILLGQEVGITAILGLITLMGIIVRNGIIMIDYAEELRIKHRLAARQAAIMAAQRRMRPIFMTCAAASMGVVPMVISNTPLWGPMGTVVMVGTIVSFFFIVTVIPVGYWGLFQVEDRKRILKNERRRILLLRRRMMKKRLL